jgi:hypothetical protein
MWTSLTIGDMLPNNIQHSSFSVKVILQYAVMLTSRTQALSTMVSTASCILSTFEDNVVELATMPPGTFSSLASVVDEHHFSTADLCIYPACLNGASIRSVEP